MLTQFFRLIWSKTIAPSAPEIIVHDPHADEPHDLDDPFFDQKVRERTAEIIAKAARKKS